MILETSLADSYTDWWRLSRCFILYQKTEDFISDSSSLSDISLLLRHDTQTCFSNIESHQFCEVKEKKNKEASYSTDDIISHSFRLTIVILSSTHSTNVKSEIITDVINIQDFFKRKADSADLNKGEKSEHRLEKVQRADQYAAFSSVNASNDSWKISLWSTTQMIVMMTLKSDSVTIFVCFQTVFLFAKLSATRENNKLKSIQWSWWQSRCAFLYIFDQHLKVFLTYLRWFSDDEEWRRKN